MWKIFKLGLLSLLLACGAAAQNVRYDQIATTTAGSGQSVPLLALPGAQVTFYSMPGMTLASTYNSATATTPCPTYSQVVPNGTAACVATADTQGNFGAWFLPGQYAYTLKVGAVTYGPFSFMAGGGTGGGVTSLNALTGALNITCGAGLTCTASGTTINISQATAFTINSFTGCSGSLELGTSVTNPVCSATYSATPASASITNTDSVDSPLTLVSPYTSGTIVGTFVHTSTATTTITLTAVGSSTQTATQQYTWNPAIFGGVGATGATSTVTASGTTAVLSTGDALQRVQLGAETVGEIFGPYSPSGQNVYLLLTGGSHTFTDNCTGFPFAFNSPIAVSFTNAHGAVVSMYLYSSTNPLTGACFSPKVAS